VSYRLTERWSVSASGRYVFDSVQDSQLDETGSVERGLSDRQRLNAGAGLDYAVSERSDIGADYNYQKTDFERKSSVDTKLTRSCILSTQVAKSERCHHHLSLICLRQFR
jgi:opacity protein-like surface antigen